MIILDIIMLVLAMIHFGVPLAYYQYAKAKWLSRPWNIKIDPNYEPKITVIIPTYNEAGLIEKKLKDITQQNYPKDKLEIIVIDSASKDGTPRIVEKWMKKAPQINLTLIEESERKGKARALNRALIEATGEIIVITDVDAWWPSKDTLSKVVKWLSNPSVGAVSCLKKPYGDITPNIEEGYRSYYNILRIAESKAWSTPIFHGELAAFRHELLRKINGFPTDIGADDSYTAVRIMKEGYRAIIPGDIWCTELVPKNNYHDWRIRRAQHLVQHFFKVLKMICMRDIPKQLRSILHIEVFLHLLNPWILLAIVIFLFIAILSHDWFPLLVLAIGVSFLIKSKSFRIWTTLQLYLVIAAVKNLKSKEIIWEKQIK